MPATRGEKIGVGIIAFLMILSILGGSLLYIFQEEQLESQIEEQNELQAEFEREQQRATIERTICSALATEITNNDLQAPDEFIPEGEVTELEITDLEEGDGEAVEAGDCVAINYHGNLAVGGLVFDSSFERANPFSTFIGNGQVIAGWDEGIIGLKVGGKRRLVIPFDKAYGESGQTRDFSGNLRKDLVNTEEDIDPTVAVDSDGDGRADYIPENATLVFEVELLDILKAEDAQAQIDEQLSALFPEEGSSEGSEDNTEETTPEEEN